VVSRQLLTRGTSGAIPCTGVFFFSSRRRHTRLVSDWSSDVCSSDLLRLALAAEDMDRPILAPPGVPPARLAALRAAFHDAMNDPGFIAEAKRQRLEVDEVAGEKVAAIIAATFALPPDVVKAANDAMHLTGSQSE